jgi:CBS domain-containing protein
MTSQAEEEQLRVANFMSSPVISISAETEFVKAVQLMVDKRIGNVVVINNETVSGIITEREILQYLVLDKTIPNKRVKYVLTRNFTRLEPEISVREAARTMIRRKTRLLVFRKHKAVKGRRADHLIGIITASDLARAFLETDRNPQLESAMTNKIVTIHPNNTILNAAKLMFKKRIGSVIVSADEHPFGIFTERDLLNKVIGQGVDIEEMVGQYCSVPVITTKIGVGANEAGRLMFAHKIKRLPLLKEDRVVAMVTARDLVEAFQRGR